MAAPTLYTRKAYADAYAYYDAVIARYRYLATEYAEKTALGICSPHLEELLCLYDKLWYLELELDIGQNYVPANAPEGAAPAPTEVLEQNNRISSKYYGYVAPSGGYTSLADIAGKINAHGLTIDEDEIHIASFLTGGSTEEAAGVFYSVYAVKPGKGTYGGSSLQSTDIALISTRRLMSPVMNSDGLTRYKVDGGADVSASANASSPVTLPANLPVVFAFGDKDYAYIGPQPATVGSGNFQTNMGHFVELDQTKLSDFLDDEGFVKPADVDGQIDAKLVDYYTKAEVDAMQQGAVDAHYVHEQSTGSATWTITHNLGKMPSVVVIDSDGNTVEGAITYNTDQQLTLEFNSPFTGTAYLN